MTNRGIYNALRSAGMTAEGACGMLGNMAAESGMRPNIAQRGMTKLSDEQYTAAADNGLIDFTRDAVGYGLCQWTHPARKAKLLAYAKNQGRSVGDAAMQTAFCLRELQEDFPAVWQLLTSSHDLLRCTQAVLADYENPAVKNLGTRMEFAQKAWDSFAEGGPEDAEGTAFEEGAVSAAPIWEEAATVLRLLLSYYGYWTGTQQEGPAFFAAARQFVTDLERGGN